MKDDVKIPQLHEVTEWVDMEEGFEGILSRYVKDPNDTNRLRIVLATIVESCNASEAEDAPIFEATPGLRGFNDDIRRMARERLAALGGGAEA